MKVTILNTNDIRGGAAKAAFRLGEMLSAAGVEVKLLVLEQKSREPFVSKVYSQEVRNKILIRGDKYAMKVKGYKPVSDFSPAYVGSSVYNHPDILDADIVHLHWINRGLLSLKGLRKLQDSGKPIVWTLHDMWAFTGGCHYSGSCMRFEDQCGACPVLSSEVQEDLSAERWLKKKAIYAQKSISFITPSNWLKETALRSTLLKNENIDCIPNPVNTEVYKPVAVSEVRQRLGIPQDKKVLLFGVERVEDERKGFAYIKSLLRDYGKTASKDNTVLMVFGTANEDIKTIEGFQVYYTGYVTDEDQLIDIYNAADVFIQASLEDNLPNTAVESVCCGTPVLAFNQGGMKDIVQHKQNGYLADFRSEDDLLTGLQYILHNRNELAIAAREFGVDTFSYKKLQQEFIRYYQNLLKSQ